MYDFSEASTRACLTAQVMGCTRYIYRSTIGYDVATHVDPKAQSRLVGWYDSAGRFHGAHTWTNQNL